jgi:tetratricopeptide (TPR) repeat protein
MTRWPLPALAALLLAGCAALPTAPRAPAAEEATAPPDVDAVLLSSRRLSAAGRWSEAIAVVDGALRRFPDAPRLVEQREQLERRWQRVRREIDDQMLVVEAEASRSRLAWLETLSRASPGDLLVTARRIFTREELQGRLPDLVACSEWHVETERSLARRCYELAAELALRADDRERLERVAGRLAAVARESEVVARRERRQQRDTDLQLRAKALLAEARQAIDRADYRAALDTLDEVAALQPDNPAVGDLRRAAEAAITPQVEALVKLGDHLYLDEQLEAALATWSAALQLSPGNTEIQARIDRARTVLGKLQDLRNRQKPR